MNPPAAATNLDNGLDRWIEKLLADDEMLSMGHEQRREDANLGLGWLYYAVTRLVRPENVVSIGSWRGFVPILLAKAMKDNIEGGRLTFIDPSLVDETWVNPDEVQARFGRFDIDNVDHYRLTTQQFVETDANQELDEIGVLFVDGYHTYEQSKFDFESFADRVPETGMIFLHDSMSERTSKFYGAENEYTYSVKLFIDELKQDDQWQVMDFPFCFGLTMVRPNCGLQA